MRDLQAIIDDNREGYGQARPMISPTLTEVGDRLAVAVFDLEEQARARRLSLVGDLDLSAVLRAANAWVCAVIDERAEV
jgi:hypothetical protein